MKAIRKVFCLEDYNKTIPPPSPLPTAIGRFFSEHTTVSTIEPDTDAYYKAIADFVTEQGPTRIISIQSFDPGRWWTFTHIWYWEMETLGSR